MLILFIILLMLSRIVIPKNNSEQAGMNMVLQHIYAELLDKLYQIHAE